VTAPIVRPTSKLVKKRDPSESKKDAAPPVPTIDPSIPTAHDVSRPATPSTVHAPSIADSETAEHVIVPPHPPRPPTPKHNVLVKKNSLSKRAAANPAAPVQAPPDLPNQDVPDTVAEVRNSAIFSEQETAGEDRLGEEGLSFPIPIPVEVVESEAFAQAHPVHVRGSTPPNGTRFIEGANGELEPTESRTTGTTSEQSVSRPGRPVRRISLRSFGFFYGKDSQPPSAFPAYVAPSERVVHEGAEPEAEGESSHRPARAHRRSSGILSIGLLTSRKPVLPKVSKSDKRAVESAMSLRTLIIGPAALDAKGGKANDLNPSAAVALRKVNHQLLVPTEANRVIAALRELPPPDLPPATAETVETIRKKRGWMFGRGGAKEEEKHKETAKDSTGTVAMPIHGCCLDVPEEEADEKHFSQLTGSRFAAQGSLANGNANIGSADLSSLIPMLKKMRLVNLQTSPDMSSVNAASFGADLAAPNLGFGEPADKPGPLAGSVPSAGSLVDGMEKVGQTLMSLGFATTTAILPSHVGVHPPKDRMSVLTCE
jgi:hypothetical protein